LTQIKVHAKQVMLLPLNAAANLSNGVTEGGAPAYDSPNGR